MVVGWGRGGVMRGGRALGCGCGLSVSCYQADAAGRAYAAYGGIYIGFALVWLAVVDGVRPDRFDLIGVGLCLVGALVIVAAPR